MGDSINNIINADFVKNDLLQIEGNDLVVVKWQNRPLQWLNKIWHRYILRDQNSVKVAKKIDEIVQNIDLQSLDNIDKLQTNLQALHKRIKNKKAQQYVGSAIQALQLPVEQSPPGSPPPEIDSIPEPPPVTPPPTPTTAPKKKSWDEWITELNTPAIETSNPLVRNVVGDLQKFKEKHLFHPLDILDRYLREEYGDEQKWPPFFLDSSDDKDELYSKLIKDLEPQGKAAQVWAKNINAALELIEKKKATTTELDQLEGKRNEYGEVLTKLYDCCCKYTDLETLCRPFDELIEQENTLKDQIKREYSKASPHKKGLLTNQLSAVKHKKNHSSITDRISEASTSISTLYIMLRETGELLDLSDEEMQIDQNKLSLEIINRHRGILSRVNSLYAERQNESLAISREIRLKRGQIGEINHKISQLITINI